MNPITEEKAAAALRQMGWFQSADSCGWHIEVKGGPDGDGACWVPGPATAVLAFAMRSETDRKTN